MNASAHSQKAKVNIRDSFWFLPTIYSLISIIAVTVVTVADYTLLPMIEKAIPDIFLTNQDIAKTLYGALITAILTMTTISFSTIMVVLTTYTTQFSPRTLQNFMKSRVTQHVLGVYSFGFIFALLNLILLTEDKKKALASPFFTVIVSIVCLAFFILFIHHSSRFVQVNNLIGEIRKNASDTIRQNFTKKQYIHARDWEKDDIEALTMGEVKYIYAEKSGYVQNINISGLVDWTKANDLLLEAQFFIGDYVQKGMPLFKYWPQADKTAELSPEESHPFLLVGNERTDLQDIEFSIQKLVEIAVKAISPSINDPHTAVNCINRIGSLLAELGSKYEVIRYYGDEEENLRLIMEPKHYQEYLYKSFYQIRIYGKHDISVMNGVLDALHRISAVNDKSVKEDVWKFGKYMMNAIDEDEMDELDYNYYKQIVEKLAAACHKDL
ncbi:DUF2254 domain-containing protein [Thalassobacillus pellis]|uniref:DUF2254 domain-containing protein n=1 Tax=Thalassobacillus pellis TaxID=748008 RepID=UPI0019600E18|nr:DUF2254 domain-containing protein [Thalassobacillus pellis]MBM7554354.1 putative membrane protein [Thalassobacillus pellis]